MNRHAFVEKRFYEYLRNELVADEHRRVEAHVSSCAKCAHNVQVLRETFEELARASSVAPSSQRPDEFWKTFALRVESRIRENGHASKQSNSRVREFLQSFFVFRKLQVASAAGAFALVALAIIVWKSNEAIQTDEPLAPPPEEVGEPADRMNQYFRKSRVLLMGLENMKHSEQPLDLTVERRASRELIREARYLKLQPIDTRSAHLIGNLEKILIEVANLEEDHASSEVDIIRSGIRRENLLFKIRMAEALRDPIRLANVKYAPHVERENP